MKKMLSVILSALMLLSVIPVFASAEGLSGAWGDNIVWTFDEETGTLTLSGSGEMKHADFKNNIPPWREFGKILKKVVIEDGITSVGSCVFYECKKIVEVSLPEGIEYIGFDAFSETGNLKHITLPSSLKKIDEEAFMGSGLTEIVIPEGVTDVGTNAFLYCYFLESAVIPQSMHHFPKYTFTNDFRLKELVNNSMFAITYPCEDYYYGPVWDVIEEIESMYSRLYDDEDADALCYAPAVEQFNSVFGTDFSLDEAGADEMVRYINETMDFEDYCGEGIPPYLTISCLADSEQHKLCKELGASHVVLDNKNDCLCGMHNIYECEDVAPTAAHNGYKGGRICLDCQAVIEESEVIPAIGRTDGETDDDDRCGPCVYRHFDETTGTITFYGTGAMFDVLPNEFYEPDIRLDQFTSVVVEEGVTSLCISFCGVYTWLESVSLPSTLESIGYGAFAYSGIREIDFPENLKSIGEHAFLCCALEKAVLPEGLLTVGDDAFTFCFFLNHIDIPSTVTEIGEGAFATAIPATVINRSSAVIPYETCADQLIFSDERLAETVLQLYWAAIKDAVTEPIADSLVPAGLYEEEIASYCRTLRDILGYSFDDTSDCSPGTVEKLLERLYEEGKVTVLSAAIEEEVPPRTLFFCLAGSPQQTECGEHNMPYKILGQDFDCALGIHDVYENDFIAPTCTQNGFKGGKICLLCETVIEAPEIIPAAGHKPVTVPAAAPSCTEPGAAEYVFCSVCGETLTETTVLPAAGHTDDNGDGECDVCGMPTDSPVSEMNFVQRVLAAIRSVLDTIIALFRKLFG